MIFKRWLPIDLIAAAVSGVFAQADDGEGVAAPTKPNIVILFSDDAGYADFGFQPNCAVDMKNLTPHIDTLARDGVRLTDAYMSASVCSPSRAGLMMGRYQQRFGSLRAPSLIFRNTRRKIGQKVI